MRIDHIALYVRDLEGARAFFQHYFHATSNTGYHNPQTGLRTYFLSFSDGARLELMQRPGLAQAPGAPALGYAHLAFSLGSRETVDALTRQLREDGYAVLSGPRTTGDGYYESCIEGWEGSILELTI